MNPSDPPLFHLFQKVREVMIVQKIELINLDLAVTGAEVQWCKRLGTRSFDFSCQICGPRKQLKESIIVYGTLPFDSFVSSLFLSTMGNSFLD